MLMMMMTGTKSHLAQLNKAHLITAPSTMAAWAQQQPTVSVLDATCFLEFKRVGCMSIAQADADVDSDNTKSWFERC